MQQIVFENEIFSKVSGFYKEKDGKYQEKTADLIVKCVNSLKEDKICEAKINLASYIGRGCVKDTAQLSGAAFFIDFEVLVEEASSKEKSEH